MAIFNSFLMLFVCLPEGNTPSACALSASASRFAPPAPATPGSPCRPRPPLRDGRRTPRRRRSPCRSVPRPPGPSSLGWDGFYILYYVIIFYIFYQEKATKLPNTSQYNTVSLQSDGFSMFFMDVHLHVHYCMILHVSVSFVSLSKFARKRVMPRCLRKLWTSVYWHYNHGAISGPTRCDAVAEGGPNNEKRAWWAAGRDWDGFW